MQKNKNACWVFETVRIISITIRLICFTEKVYGSNPYSPNIYVFFFILGWISYVYFTIVSIVFFLILISTVLVYRLDNRLRHRIEIKALPWLHSWKIIETGKEKRILIKSIEIEERIP